MANVTYPNGQVFTSTALTKDQLNQILQPLISQMFGLTSESNNWNEFVRIGWNQEGAPAWTVTDDFVSFTVSEEDSEYNKIRDYNRQSNPGGFGQGGYGSPSYGNTQSTEIVDTYLYTRVWRVRATIYGPNSTDNARQIRSTLLFPWVHDILAISNLYVVPRLSAPLRVPELFEGRWWEVVSFQFLMNEQVTETLTVPLVASVEVQSNVSSGQYSDITISPS